MSNIMSAEKWASNLCTGMEIYLQFCQAYCGQGLGVTEIMDRAYTDLKEYNRKNEVQRYEEWQERQKGGS